MKLAGHSFNNEVFDSLLDGLKDDVIVKPKEKKAQSPVSGMDVFSSSTSSTLDAVHMDQMKILLAEFDFAAKAAKVAYSQDDFVKFANESKGLRGKELERSAQKFCSNLCRQSASPKGATKHTASDNQLESMSSHTVIPAGYSTEFGPNESKSGHSLGSLKNPNSIWDSDALTRKAQTQTPDERIKTAQNDKEAAIAKNKVEMWNDLAKDGKDPNIISKGILPTKFASVQESAHNPNLGDHHLSVFNDDRDFSKIKEDSGKSIKEASDKRSSKKSDNKSDWDHSEPAKNTRSSLDSLFEGWLKK